MTMPSYLLMTDLAESPRDDETPFLWNSSDGSSFLTNVTPELNELGTVPAQNIDFVAVAVAVWAADRSTLRQGGGSNWNKRAIAIRIPVYDCAAWNAAIPDLTDAINFLTGDDWTFEFYSRQNVSSPADLTLVDTPFDRVVLLSGGADSACGALESRDNLDGGTQLLVSHFSQTSLAPVQKELAAELEKLLPKGTQDHKQIRFSRRDTGPGGVTYRSEPSSRSRSLLFLALGLAAAAPHGKELWIPENGYASLNVPLGPERRGSLSTRTTNPWFLWRLRQVLTAVGAHNDLRNPFESLTKGEMFTRAARLLGADPAGKYLSLTNSCSHTDQRFAGFATATACGVCFGCVLRRSSFKTAALNDTASYVDQQDSEQAKRYLAGKSSLPSFEDFLARGVSTADIIAMPLPPAYTRSAALDLQQRGMDELADYLA
jgi:hypothetical protein